MKITKKALLAELVKGQVQVTMIGGLAAEDWPAHLESIKQQYPDAVESKDRIEFGAVPGQIRFTIKPKFTRVRCGRFSHGSTRYDFTWGDQCSSGGLSDLYIGETGHLELKMFNGAVLRYEVLTTPSTITMAAAEVACAGA